MIRCLYFKTFSNVLKASFQSVTVTKRRSPISTVLKGKFGSCGNSMSGTIALISGTVCTSHNSADDPQVP